jgi:hypothetical protein
MLPFEYEEVEGEERITSHAGAPLVVETYRATGAAEAVRRCVKSRPRRRDRGLTDEELVESFVVLIASGGEHNEDFEALRADGGLSQLVGHAMPSPSRAKEFLYAFHEEAKGEGAAQRRLFEPSFVPVETGPLAGLAEAVRASVWAAQKRRTCDRATIDLDATIVVSEKREAAMTYTGESGYQPVIALWAEKDVILADEFRDGNVPAGHEPLRCLKRAVDALPEGMERVYLRADSAAYEHDLMGWCNEKNEEGDPRVIYAISADMTRQLRAEIGRLPLEAWQPFDSDGKYNRQWAEVAYVPSLPYERKGERPDRYLAIRVEPRQGEMFSDGTEVKHFCVVTNDWGREGAAIFRWHRKKCGTVEKVHDVLKNELGAGVMPCGRFGANAAWFRLNVLTYNLLSVMKRTALPASLHRARPKRLRFQILRRAGEIIRHARKLMVRLTGRLGEQLGLFTVARRRLVELAQLVLGTGPPVASLAA